MVDRGWENNWSNWSFQWSSSWYSLKFWTTSSQFSKMQCFLWCSSDEYTSYSILINSVGSRILENSNSLLIHLLLQPINPVLYYLCYSVSSYSIAENGKITRDYNLPTAMAQNVIMDFIPLFLSLSLVVGLSVCLAQSSDNNQASMGR